MRNLFKRYRMLLMSQLLIGGLFYSYPKVAMQAYFNAMHFTVEILKVLPPVLLLIGLLNTWVSTKAIEIYLGKRSGAKGIFLAMLMGSIAAGPLFAAFPIAASLEIKGGRVANTVIFLGSWATIKIPMLMIESQSVGLKFSLLRLVLTIPFIVLTGFLVEASLDRHVRTQQVH